MKVVIIGAGIGGLGCALASLQEGIEVVVLERAPELLPIGAGIQIPPNAARIARRLGLLPELLERGSQVDALCFRRYQDGRSLLWKPEGTDTAGRFNAPWIVIHRADYLDILVSAAKAAGVQLRLGAEVEMIDFDPTAVNLKGGEILQADVIVGADGLWSTSREQLLQRSCPPAETGDLAYRGTFTKQQLLSLNDSRVVELCSRKEVTVWLGPDRHAVFYPLKGGQQFNLVLLRPDNIPHGTRTMPGDIDEMRATFDGWDDILTKIVSCLSTVLKWKLCHFQELPTWVRDSTVLLGDACHPTLPYQAQGAAMALEDGATLGRLLGLTNKLISDGGHSSDSKRARDNVQQTLHLFESLRKARTTFITKGSDLNQKWYHLPDGPEQEARDAAMIEYVKGADWPAWGMTDRKHEDRLFGFDGVSDCEEAFDRMYGERPGEATIRVQAQL